MSLSSVQYINPVTCLDAPWCCVWGQRFFFDSNPDAGSFPIQQMTHKKCFEVSNVPLVSLGVSSPVRLSTYPSTFVVSMVHYKWMCLLKKKQATWGALLPALWFKVQRSRFLIRPVCAQKYIHLIKTQSWIHFTVRFHTLDFSWLERWGVVGTGCGGVWGNALLSIWINHKPGSEVRQKPHGFISERTADWSRCALSESGNYMFYISESTCKLQLLSYLFVKSRTPRNIINRYAVERKKPWTCCQWATICLVWSWERNCEEETDMWRQSFNLIWFV